jgi:DNA-binding response OmpR family regulator
MSGKKILIVEDEPAQLTMVAKRLKMAGYAVVGARDGIGAISTARKEQPDLILLDLGIPGGDGFVVMQRLQTLLSTSTIPIVVISSHDPTNSEEASKRAGAIAYLHKPVDFEKLFKLIAEAIGTPELSP